MIISMLLLIIIRRTIIKKKLTHPLRGESAGRRHEAAQALHRTRAAIRGASGGNVPG